MSPISDNGGAVLIDSHQGAITTATTRTGSSASSTSEGSGRLVLPNPLTLLADADVYFEDAAYLKGFAGYWDLVAPKLQKLLLCYLNGAFKVMGVDLNSIPEGAPIPPLNHLSRHDKVMQRFLEVLENAGVISKKDDGHFRGAANVPAESLASDLFNSIIANHPHFAVDARMMAVTGPQLGECLTGKVDPLGLMFRNKAASKILEDFYLLSPVFAALTEHLVSFLGLLLNRVQCSKEMPLKIFEVGAGLGGTTTRLIEFIKAMGVPVEYTFTDISSTLTKNASAKYKDHADWMRFMPFDIEKPVPEELKGKYHVVIGTMVVHATSSRTNSCSRLYEILDDGGFVILSEGTQVIDWYDAAFGLLEGWWLSEGYALQPAEVWMQDFRQAGFQQCGYSGGLSREAQTQRLLLAWKDTRM